MGQFFLSIGIVVVAFVGYQLWGTGLQEASAQSSLREELSQRIETTETIAQTNTGQTERADAPSTEPARPLNVDRGDAFARFEAPSIDVDKIAVEGVDVGDLRSGPGHFPGSSAPGHAGNVAFAGHRTTYGAPFNSIDELKVGDDIHLETEQGRFTYRIIPASEAFGERATQAEDEVISIDESHMIVDPSATWVLDDFGDNRLTLTACHPKYSARERIIVAAVLVGSPVGGHQTNTTSDPIAELPQLDQRTEPVADDTHELSLNGGLSGDASALLPALLWAMTAIAIYVGVRVGSSRWHRWWPLGIGAVPLLLTIGLAFEKVDRLLPAA